MTTIKQCLLAVCILYSLCSCGDDFAQQLDGSWDLVDVSCECEVLVLADNDHVWQFDSENSQVTIYNKLSVDHPAIISSGTYDINILENVVTIESIDYLSRFENEQLILDSGSSFDNPLLVFERN